MHDYFPERLHLKTHEICETELKYKNKDIVHFATSKL